MLLATRPRKLPPTIPVTQHVTDMLPKAAEQSPTSCREVAMGAEFRTKVSRKWAMLAKQMPKLAQCWPCSTPELATSENTNRQSSTKPGRHGPHIDQLRPTSAQLWTISANMGPPRPILADFGPKPGSLGDFATPLALFGITGFRRRRWGCMFGNAWRATHPQHSCHLIFAATLRLAPDAAATRNANMRPACQLGLW